MKKQLIIFTDIGDTVVDEGTEVKVPGTELVLRADCIPGAVETMRRLYDEGFTILMVADGLVQSFHNTMTQHGLDDIFTAKIISERIGEQKPSRKMFQAALDAAGLGDEDKKRIIMVGNNIRRDVLGANRFGIRSVLLTWSPRYSYVAETPEMEPDYRIAAPCELLDLAHRLEDELNAE